MKNRDTIWNEARLVYWLRKRNAMNMYRFMRPYDNFWSNWPKKLKPWHEDEQIVRGTLVPRHIEIFYQRKRPKHYSPAREELFYRLWGYKR